MGRPRRRINPEVAWDMARWLYRYFEETEHNRTTLCHLNGVQSLQIGRRDKQARALADLQGLADELPAALWNKVPCCLRMMVARHRRDLASIELP